MLRGYTVFSRSARVEFPFRRAGGQNSDGVAPHTLFEKLFFLRKGFEEGFRGDLFQKLGEVMGGRHARPFLNFKKNAQKKIGSGLGFDLFFGNDFGGGDSFFGQRQCGFWGKVFGFMGNLFFGGHEA